MLYDADGNPQTYNVTSAQQLMDLMDPMDPEADPLDKDDTVVLGDNIVIANYEAYRILEALLSEIRQNGKLQNNNGQYWIQYTEFSYIDVSSLDEIMENFDMENGSPLFDYTLKALRLTQDIEVPSEMIEDLNMMAQSGIIEMNGFVFKEDEDFQKTRLEVGSWEDLEPLMESFNPYTQVVVLTDDIIVPDQQTLNMLESGASNGYIEKGEFNFILGESEEPSSPKLTLLTQNVNGSVAVDFKTEQSEYADAIGGNNGAITFTSDSNGTGSVNAGDVEWTNNNKYLVFKCDISCDGTYSVAFMPNFAEDANVKIGYSMVDVTSHEQALNCTSFQPEGLSFAQLGGDNTIYLVVAIVDVNSPATISGGFDVTVNVAESN